jgi:hypothetical protein
MKIIAYREEPAHKIAFTAAVKCDLCGKEAPSPNSYMHPWAPGTYDVEDVTIEYKTGSSYPEGTDTTTHTMDMCPDCFKDKLIPWLESQGVKMREED